MRSRRACAGWQTPTRRSRSWRSRRREPPRASRRAAATRTERPRRPAAPARWLVLARSPAARPDAAHRSARGWCGRGTATGRGRACGAAARARARCRPHHAIVGTSRAVRPAQSRHTASDRKSQVQTSWLLRCSAWSPTHGRLTESFESASINSRWKARWRSRYDRTASACSGASCSRLRRPYRRAPCIETNSAA